MKNLIEYKDQLIADPKKTLIEEFGLDISDDIDIKILFETENTRYIVIPYKEAGLSENEIIKMGSGPCTTTSPRTHISRC